jgi:hypothetical protein
MRSSQEKARFARITIERAGVYLTRVGAGATEEPPLYGDVRRLGSFPQTSAPAPASYYIRSALAARLGLCHIRSGADETLFWCSTTRRKCGPHKSVGLRAPRKGGYGSRSGVGASVTRIRGEVPTAVVTGCAHPFLALLCNAGRVDLRLGPLTRTRRTNTARSNASGPTVMCIKRLGGEAVGTNTERVW